jgi:translation initiation factor 2 gamma subunit (eIF-2gamma)
VLKIDACKCGAAHDPRCNIIGMDVFNVNVGVLGHVDSGKTSLVAALSDVLSVAALDKDPQSQARGITLDLGLSAFKVFDPPKICCCHCLLGGCLRKGVKFSVSASVFPTYLARHTTLTASSGMCHAMRLQQGTAAAM